jgi:hypothetical protein
VVRGSEPEVRGLCRLAESQFVTEVVLTRTASQAVHPRRREQFSIEYGVRFDRPGEVALAELYERYVLHFRHLKATVRTGGPDRSGSLVFGGEAGLEVEREVVEMLRID